MSIEELNTLLANHKVIFCLSKEERLNRSKVASKPHLKKNRRLIAKQSRRNNR